VYVDESGQDTYGKIFFVAVVIIGSERDVLRGKLKTAERLSSKYDKKWTKARRTERKSYLQQLIQIKGLVGLLYYGQYQDSRAYVDLTVLSIVAAILDTTEGSPYKATVIVDGLKRGEQRRIATALRKYNVRLDKVRGAREQSDEFIRLADAVAGWVRDSVEEYGDMRLFFTRAKRRGILKKCKEKPPFKGA